jgi:hypothetical protein
VGGGGGCDRGGAEADAGWGTRIGGLSMGRAEVAPDAESFFPKPKSVVRGADSVGTAGSASGVSCGLALRPVGRLGAFGMRSV